MTGDDKPWPGQTSYDTGERECSLKGCEETTGLQIFDRERVEP